MKRVRSFSTIAFDVDVVIVRPEAGKLVGQQVVDDLLRR
jgi:hypothetical protein